MSIKTFSEMATQPDIDTYFEFTAGSAIVVVDYSLKKWSVEFEDGNSGQFDSEQDAVEFALEKLRSYRGWNDEQKRNSTRGDIGMGATLEGYPERWR